jgi:hypothetical protein
MEVMVLFMDGSFHGSISFTEGHSNSGITGAGGQGKAG